MTQTLAMLVSRKRVVLASFLLTIIMCFSVGYSGPVCPEEAEYNLNSTSGLAFKNNVESLLSELSSKASNPNGFYNFTVVKAGAATAYGLFYCFAEAKPSECQTCVEASRSDILQDCANKTRGIIWGDKCFLRFSNESIFSRPDTDNGWYACNTANVADIPMLNQVLGEAFNKIEYDAAYNDISGRRYAVQVSNYIANLKKIYSMGQCSPDLSSQDCYNCLELAISKLPDCCYGLQGGNVLYPNYRIRYETYPFFTPPPPPPPPPPVPSPPPNQGDWIISTTIIVLGIVFLVTIITSFYVSKRTRNTWDPEVIDERTALMKNIQTETDSLWYNFGDLQAYTETFAHQNLIGQGEFGLVYKATLPSHQLVAVKRLSKIPAHGGKEYISSEIAHLATLQHENLVRLLGYCLEREEKFLIYEFVFNKSLDCFLFDPGNQPLLDWITRYKIIKGIALGLMYLHYPPTKIIHSGLKASNVLLDQNMNPKITDFGMARLFKIDHFEGRIPNTRSDGKSYLFTWMKRLFRIDHEFEGNIDGTNNMSGYMAPEYASHDLLSEKFDVFSFGVLVLEIISGMKNNNLLSFGGDDLVSYARKKWINGTPFAIIDPSMENSYEQNEVIRCIYIALLCVVKDVEQRPTMASVVVLLTNFFA